MNKIEIRELKEDDIESLEKLYRQFWNENSNVHSMKMQFSTLSTNADYVFLIAEVDKKIVGSIMGIVCYELYGKCEPFFLMEDLVVDECHRRIGVGKALVYELEKIAKQKGCYQILFITEANRKNTIKFYESIEFDSKKYIGFKRPLK